MTGNSYLWIRTQFTAVPVNIQCLSPWSHTLKLLLEGEKNNCISISILSLFFSHITFTLFSDSTEMVPSFCLCLRASLPGDPKCLFLVVSATLPSEIVVVQSLSHVRLFVTPWTAVCQASLSFTISWSLLKFMSIESVMPSNHLIL